MSAPEAACRECHRSDQHKLSCSHVRYEGRTVVQPADEVALPHEAQEPYCPGPEVECYFENTRSALWPDAPCQRTGDNSCYYAESRI